MAIDFSRWKPEQLHAARLLAEPSGQRMMNKDIALAVGVTENTISRWKNDEDFRQLVNDLAMAYMGDFLPTANEVLMDNIVRQRSNKALELYYKLMGMLKDVKQVRADIEVTDGNAPKTATDVEKRLADLRRRTGMDSDETE